MAVTHHNQVDRMNAEESQLDQEQIFVQDGCEQKFNIRYCK